MELNLVKTTYSELDGAARCILGWKRQPFCFIRMQNTLYMNKNMKGIRKLTAAVETLWKYDFMETEEIMAEFDEAYSTIKDTAGDQAADQVLTAWNDMASESRIEKAKSAALEWVKSVYEKLDDDDWERMCNAGYSDCFIKDGLWRAFCQLEKNHPDSQRYQNWSTSATEAAFVYGFQLGAQSKA